MRVSLTATPSKAMTTNTIHRSMLGLFTVGWGKGRGVLPENAPGCSSDGGRTVRKTVRATRAKEVRLEKPAEKHPSPGHTHVGFGRRSVAKLGGGWVWGLHPKEEP